MLIKLINLSPFPVKYLQVVAATSLLVACGALAGCEKKELATASEEQETISADDAGLSRFFLSEDALALALEVDRALDGDQAAADRVYMHFAMSAPHDRETLLHWKRIAAENGSAGYMIAYARTLYEEGGRERCRRALFWLKRAVEFVPETSKDSERLARKIEQDSACRRSE